MYQLKDLEDTISVLAVITTILQFLSGVLVCKQYIVNRTTADATPLLFICGVISTSLWLLYGFTKEDSKIILVNVVGVILMVAYTIIFYRYTFKKSHMMKLILATVLLLVITTSYVYIEENIDTVISRLGSLACLFTLATVGAPLSKLAFVIKAKSTECLPFPMILMSLFVSSLWLLYGLIKDDIFLCVPNLIGAVLAVIQLSLFVIFPNVTVLPSMVKHSVI